jgi:hypothetical protein
VIEWENGRAEEAAEDSNELVTWPTYDRCSFLPLSRHPHCERNEILSFSFIITWITDLYNGMCKSTV